MLKSPLFLFCFSITYCLLFNTQILFSQNVFVRYTTNKLLARAEKEGTSFLNEYPTKNLNYALPLIDSETSVKLCLLSSSSGTNGNFFDGLPDWLYPVGLQIRNKELRNILFEQLKQYDCRCADSIIRTPVKYDDYRITSMHATYEYSATLVRAFYKQFDETDTSFLGDAIKEFEIWGTFAWGFMDTITKPGMHQLSIGKKRFDPCMLASGVNANIWARYIHFLTDKKEYDSGNEKLNYVYNKIVRQTRFSKDPDELKGLIRMGKPSPIILDHPCTTLDTLDLEEIPLLKEKIDTYKKKEDATVLFYSNNKKGLLYFYYTEKMTAGFTKRYVGFPSMYLLELNSPSNIIMTEFNYRERFLY